MRAPAGGHARRAGQQRGELRRLRAQLALGGGQAEFGAHRVRHEQPLCRRRRQMLRIGADQQRRVERSQRGRRQRHHDHRRVDLAVDERRLLEAGGEQGAKLGQRGAAADARQLGAEHLDLAQHAAADRVGGESLAHAERIEHRAKRLRVAGEVRPGTLRHLPLLDDQIEHCAGAGAGSLLDLLRRAREPVGQRAADRASTLQRPGAPDRPLEEGHLLRLVGPPGEREAGLQPVEQVAPVQVVGDQVVPAHYRRGGAGRRQLPAGLVAHRHLRTLEQRANPPRGEAIERHQGDRADAGAAPVEHLPRHRARLLLERRGGQHRQGRIGGVAGERVATFGNRHLGLAAGQLGPCRREQRARRERGSQVGRDEQHRRALRPALQQGLFPRGKVAAGPTGDVGERSVRRRRARLQLAQCRGGAIAGVAARAPQLQHQLRLRLQRARGAAVEVTGEARLQATGERLAVADRRPRQFVGELGDAGGERPQRRRLWTERIAHPGIGAQRREQLGARRRARLQWPAQPRRERRDARWHEGRAAEALAQGSARAHRVHACRHEPGQCIEPRRGDRSTRPGIVERGLPGTGAGCVHARRGHGVTIASIQAIVLTPSGRCRPVLIPVSSHLLPVSARPPRRREDIS